MVNWQNWLILSIVEETFLELVMDGLPYWAKMPPRHWKKRFTGFRRIV